MTPADMAILQMAGVTPEQYARHRTATSATYLPVLAQVLDELAMMTALFPPPGRGSPPDEVSTLREALDAVRDALTSEDPECAPAHAMRAAVLAVRIIRHFQEGGTS